MRHGAASTQQLEDVVLVDGVVHRLAHQHVAERPIVGRRRVHRQVRDSNLLEHEDPIVVVGVLPEARDHAGRDRIAHDVELICLDLLNGRVCVDPHAELDPRVGGRIAPVMRVEHEGGALADRAGFEQVRPGADRRLAECLGVIGGQIRRDDGRERHGQDVEEREIGIGDRDLDRVIVDGDEPGRLVGLTIHDGLPALDQREERAADRRGRRSQVRAEQPIEREDDVVGRDRHAVVPANAVPDTERGREAVVREVERVREGGRVVQVLVIDDEVLEHDVPDDLVAERRRRRELVEDVEVRPDREDRRPAIGGSHLGGGVRLWRGAATGEEDSEKDSQEGGGQVPKDPRHRGAQCDRSALQMNWRPRPYRTPQSATLIAARPRSPRS